MLRFFSLLDVLICFAECILGTVTDKAKAHMKKEAEAAAKAKAEASTKKTDVVLSMQQ
jgi:nitrate reductase (NAD(P)H)